ncbi:hypothetical protein EDF61_102320 [Arthrobacter sp. JUb115]|nr:hypothetical protein EDF61_102320 [Arthrobacter sp. JUb115]
MGQTRPAAVKIAEYSTHEPLLHQGSNLIERVAIYGREYSAEGRILVTLNPFTGFRCNKNYVYHD